MVIRFPFVAVPVGHVLLLWCTMVCPGKADVTIAYRTDCVGLDFAVSKFEQALQPLNAVLVRDDLANVSPDTDVIIVSREAERVFMPTRVGERSSVSSVNHEGYQIVRYDVQGRRLIAVLAGDETGAVYGTLDLAEQVGMAGGLAGVQNKTCTPRFEFRAIKFNLPWSPYRGHEAASLHMETCKDLKFWRQFLDMMVTNRFNVLSLWNLHPFPYMIRPKNFPAACPFDDRELAKWQRFWRRLFKMAKDRGIETYVVNWNIVVSPQFAKAYGAGEKNDTSAVVRDYTRQCVTQVIDEYEDLTGLGVTLADWMNDMTPKAREDWIEDTFVAGMQSARRRVKFIHRSVLAGSPGEMRRVIDAAHLPDPVWVEIKFNWSHGHSTPVLAITHDHPSGQIDEGFWNPTPINFRIAWMIRNEDFFILRWGRPDFIRQHIAANGRDYVGGYFVGSEGYIPAKDYSHESNSHVSWEYAFEKQWLFYMLWGRLLYDPETSDDVFAGAFEARYGKGIGRQLLKAYALAGKMPLRLASFHAATWDFTLYSEGFLAPARSRGLFDGVSPFISIDELISHETLDPTYLSIKDYAEHNLNRKEIAGSYTTPLELADELEEDAEVSLDILNSLSTNAMKAGGPLECEIADVRAWAYLSLYFADKLRAGVALEIYRQTHVREQKERAVALLETAAGHWDLLTEVTSRHYRPVPSVQLGQTKFSWEQYKSEVARDIQIAREE